VVFSSTPTEPLEWDNSTLVTGDAADAVRVMKENGDWAMRTIGSLILCRSLLVAGLVDRFRMVMFAVITGATDQERIYDGYPDVPSTWWTAAPSTARSSWSNTCRGCCTAQPARPDRPSSTSSGPQTIMATRPTRHYVGDRRQVDHDAWLSFRALSSCWNRSARPLPVLLKTPEVPVCLSLKQTLNEVGILRPI
jgi:hypothetical protein